MLLSYPYAVKVNNDEGFDGEGEQGEVLSIRNTPEISAFPSLFIYKKEENKLTRQNCICTFKYLPYYYFDI